jgi:hypothetical protein
MSSLKKGFEGLPLIQREELVATVEGQETQQGRIFGARPRDRLREAGPA